MDAYVYEFSSKLLPDDVAFLFAQADWTGRRSMIGIQAMLDNTRVCLGVWAGEHLIGFARAVTDDVYRAFIEDLIVHQDYRGQGIGSEMMRRLLERLDHVEEIVLNCDDQRVEFYRQFGFERSTMTHMHIWKGG